VVLAPRPALQGLGLPTPERPRRLAQSVAQGRRRCLGAQSRGERDRRAGRAQRRRGERGAGSNGCALKKTAPPVAALALSYQERKNLLRRHRKVEKRILELEALQSRLALVLSDRSICPTTSFSFSTSEDLRVTRDELTALYEEWEGLAEAVACLEGAR